MINILLGFILGVLFVSALQPILDSLVALILTMLEAAKGYFGMRVTKYNQDISDLVNPEDKINKIGFAYEEEEYDE